jgi:hypothetical protein
MSFNVSFVNEYLVMSFVNEWNTWFARLLDERKRLPWLTMVGPALPPIAY